MGVRVLHAQSRETDHDGFCVEAEHARRLGFKGKSCIHPSQVAHANKVFCPSSEEIIFAERIIAAWSETAASGRGAIVVDGKMIDRPFAERAHSILALARRIGLAA